MYISKRAIFFFSSNGSIDIVLNFIPTSTRPSWSSLWQLYWIFTEINWIPGERGNCWGQFGGFWASPWPQSVIKDTLTLFNLIFRFPGNFWNLLILIHFLQNDNNLNVACWITVISTNITLLFIFAFFNPTAENLGGDKSCRLLNGTFSADQMRPVKNYGCGLEFITFPQILNILFFTSPPFHNLFCYEVRSKRYGRAINCINIT